MITPVLHARPDLSAIPQDRLDQIMARLQLHFPKLSGTIEDALGDYPEDLVCAAYRHLLTHHRSPVPPGVSDFIAFMEPEMTARRRNALRKYEVMA
jgi:hypothetical protein